MKTRTFLVAYSYSKGERSYFGRICLKVDYKITASRIGKLENHIRDVFGFDNVVISSFQELEQEE